MALSEIRNGNFNSSEIVSLVSEGKAKGSKGSGFYTFIKQTHQERQLNRSLGTETSARSTKWGSFVEKWVIETAFLGLEYTYTPNLTKEHPKHNFWVGSRDAIKNTNRAVADLKSPYSLTSFADFAELFLLWQSGKYTIKQILCDGVKLDNGITIKHKDGEKYFWQLASNCHIEGTNKAELIIFCPTLEQLKEIMVSAGTGENEGNNELYFIAFGMVDEFPFIPEESNYPNVLKFEFEFKQEDLDFLESRVIEAKEILDSLDTTNTLTINDQNIKIIEKIN